MGRQMERNRKKRLDLKQQMWSPPIDWFFLTCLFVFFVVVVLKLHTVEECALLPSGRRECITSFISAAHNKRKHVVLVLVQLGFFSRAYFIYLVTVMGIITIIAGMEATSIVQMKRRRKKALPQMRLMKL